MFALFIGVFIHSFFTCNSLPNDYEALKIIKDDNQFNTAENVDSYGYDLEIVPELPSNILSNDISRLKIEDQYESIAGVNPFEDGPLLESSSQVYTPLNAYNQDLPEYFDESQTGDLDYVDSLEHIENNPIIDDQNNLYELPVEEHSEYEWSVEHHEHQPSIEYHESEPSVIQPPQEYEYLIPSHVDTSHEHSKHSRSSKSIHQSNYLKDQQSKHHRKLHDATMDSENGSNKRLKSLFVFGPVMVNIGEMKLRI